MNTTDTPTDDETWAVIRCAYLGGATARSLERVMGVKADTVWKRAASEGWGKGRGSREALPASASVEREDDPGYPPPEHPVDVAVVAIKRAGEALLSNRAIDVQRYLRAAVVARSLKADDEAEVARAEAKVRHEDMVVKYRARCAQIDAAFAKDA